MASTRLSVLLSLVFLLLSFVVPCNSCGNHPSHALLTSIGGVVHGEIVQRSRYLFTVQNDMINNTVPKTYHARIAQWLQKYDGSVLAGSFMPDW